MPKRLVILLALVAGAAAARAAELVELRVRDATSGAPLEALASIRAAAGGATRDIRLRAGEGGVAAVALGEGSYDVHVRAGGYGDGGARLVVGEGAPASWTFLLELVVGRPAVAPGGQPLPGEALVVGRVLAAESGAPVVDARVAVAGAEARTAADGSFELAVEARNPELPGRPEALALEVVAAGRRGVRTTILPFGGTISLPFVLARGDGFDVRRDEHRWLGDRGGAELAAFGEESELEPESSPEAPGGTLAPPASVRVGFADASCTTPCCTGSCSAVCVLPLETYVGRGLNDEWIASWGPDSLRAGAVAYRSYAAYRVDHPASPGYDLCSSACCQVNDPDTSAATDAAVAATAGILLERNDAAFQAEYSAENNAWDDPDDGLPCSNSDLSCGDGAVGSPAWSWPCLADAVAATHGCFGHGRGMSQWGSKRWGDPPYQDSWKAILDHYYNATGNPSGLRSAFLASPVAIDGGRVCPGRAGAGNRVSLHLDATDLAALPHPAALFGASLIAPGGDWISDPDDDAPAPLAPGSANRESREFDLPPGAAAGLYDAALALWLDVDGDAAVTGADLLLDLEVFEGVLELAGGVDLLFADCFESGEPRGWGGAQ